MPLTCSLFYFQSAGVSVFYPLYVGRITALPFWQTATVYKGEIHASPVGGS